MEVKDEAFCYRETSREASSLPVLEFSLSALRVQKCIVIRRNFVIGKRVVKLMGYGS